MKIILYFLSVILFMGVASACSCVEESFEDSFQRSTGVFTGEVISVEGQLFSDYEKITFEVSNVWKGLNYSKIVVKTHESGATCGYNFENGGEYLVYTQKDYEVSLCSRTQELSSAQNDLNKLGKSNELIENSNESKLLELILLGVLVGGVTLFSLLRS